MKVEIHILSFSCIISYEFKKWRFVKIFLYRFAFKRNYRILVEMALYNYQLKKSEHYYKKDLIFQFIYRLAKLKKMHLKSFEGKLKTRHDYQNDWANLNPNLLYFFKFHFVWREEKLKNNDISFFSSNSSHHYWSAWPRWLKQ